MKTNAPFFVISAEQAGLSAADNATRTESLQRLLVGFGMHAIAAVGRYDGVQETSFIVLGKADQLQRDADFFARFYDQESVLHVDANRRAYLQFTAGERVELGTWREVIGGLNCQENGTLVGDRLFVATK